MNPVRAIADSLASKGIDGILISNIKNVRYLTGFSGSSACLLISGKGSLFCTDPRYEEQARREVEGFDRLVEREDRPKEVLERARSMGVEILGFESSVSYQFYRSLLRRGMRVRAVSNLVEDMRKIKDAVEMRRIERAIGRAERAYLAVRPYVRPGVTERQIALRLEEKLKAEGCFCLPFDIIVASGGNSAMPHARPTERKLRPGDLVIIDWGGEADGYFSDMTRTVMLKGRGMARKREIYETVLRANADAIGSVSEGQTARMIDSAARDVIKKEGYGDFFGHGTGHGVGLDIHELPRISRLGRDSLKSGMVFTIEPGIYIPGLGGVRIEDMVRVAGSGCRVLTTLGKAPEII